MGWTGIYMSQKPNIRDFMRKEYGRDGFEIVEDGISGSTYYAAMRKIDKPEEVFGVVILTRWKAGEFCFKTMDETMGPVESQAPQKVLRALSPTQSQYATQWRERCWDYHKARREGAKKNVALEEGDELVYAPDGEERDLSFGKYGSYSRFLVTYGRTRKGNRVIRFKIKGTGMRAQISRAAQKYLVPVSELAPPPPPLEKPRVETPKYEGIF